MRVFKAVRGVAVAASVAVGLLGVLASTVMATPLKICVPEKEGAAIKTPKKGVCAAKTTGTVLLPEAEEEKLAAILPYEKYVASGVGGKPTIQISGANLQVLSGSGSTDGTVNGAGNVIIGYDEAPGAQTGSHNLVLGGKQTYTSYGSLVGGWDNTASGPFTDAFGLSNTASGEWTSVSGGAANIASGEGASVSGGVENTVTGHYSSVSGGVENRIESAGASVSGGFGNIAAGDYDWVSGGYKNEVFDDYSSASGGDDNKAIGTYSSVSGGYDNKATGEYSSILGGKQVTLATEYGISP
jgi:hypothetical protein